MPLKEVPDGWISVPYEIGDPPLVFVDAIVMEKSEYDSLTPIQVEEIKVGRYQAWLESITHEPPTPAPPNPPV
jgi:hypothetical protein